MRPPPDFEPPQRRERFRVTPLMLVAAFIAGWIVADLITALFSPPAPITSGVITCTDCEGGNGYGVR